MINLERQNIKNNTKIYNTILKQLRSELGENIPINHVGSTAIPSMYGKNIIDILVGAHNEKELENLTIKLKNLGYYPGKNSTGMIYRFFASTEEETKAGDIHIHLVIIDSDRYRDFLILKNYLLKNKLETKNYSDFKKKLVDEGYILREDYKSIKSQYVSQLLERARNDLNNHI